MIDMNIPFLQKITHGARRPSGKRRRKSIDGAGNKKPSSNKIRGQIAEEGQSLSDQILRKSNESYDQGVIVLKAKKHDDAREYFEDALAARLVLYGPNDECILEVHDKLRRIALIQEDDKKAAYHQLRITNIEASVMLRKANQHHDTVDWSVLCKDNEFY